MSDTGELSAYSHSMDAVYFARLVRRQELSRVLLPKQALSALLHLLERRAYDQIPSHLALIFPLQEGCELLAIARHCLAGAEIDAFVPGLRQLYKYQYGLYKTRESQERLEGQERAVYYTAVYEEIKTCVRLAATEPLAELFKVGLTHKLSPAQLQEVRELITGTAHPEKSLPA